MISSVTLGQVASLFSIIAIVGGGMGYIFSKIYLINRHTKEIEDIYNRLDSYEILQASQKGEILNKVEETNSAVNLLCSAISALIDNEITDKGNIEELRRIKTKLDDKKELV